MRTDVSERGGGQPPFLALDDVQELFAALLGGRVDVRVGQEQLFEEPSESDALQIREVAGNAHDVVHRRTRFWAGLRPPFLGAWLDVLGTKAEQQQRVVPCPPGHVAASGVRVRPPSTTP